MELVHGTPITDYCDREKLTIAERLELFVLVCRAVQHAHQKGVIHRDLKPSNILVTMVDGAAVPKIIDFGVAKATGFSLTERTLYTGFHQLIGTPMYMSPEQAQLAGADVDTRSDVYSLGVLLYELLAGTTPFDQETFRTAAFDVVRRIIREDEPPKPSTRLSALGEARTSVSANRKADARHLDRALRGELDWIVMKALEKDRRRRYETAHDLAADVMRYLTDRPVDAGPPSAWYQFSKYARRNKAALTTAILVAAALLIGSGASAWQAVRATRAEARASANEAQAQAAAGAERTARQAAVNERRRAETSERQAKERLVEVERQRKQAEKHLEAALEAVDRMLGHVGDRELNNVPRAGQVRSKILSDAIALYERLPLESDVSAEARFRVVQTWTRIGKLAWELEVFEQANRAYSSAIVLLEALVGEQPGQTEYRATLAQSLHASGWLLWLRLKGGKEAEKAFRRAIELNAGLASDNPTEESWLILQARSLNYLSRLLSARGTDRDEALGHATRAFELLERCSVAGSHWRGQVLCNLARFSTSPAEKEVRYRRAIKEFRDFLAITKDPTSTRDASSVVPRFRSISRFLEKSAPDESETLLDESIALARRLWDLSPYNRDDLSNLVESLLMQARRQRRLVADQTVNEDPARMTARLAKAESLFVEAITWQRQKVSLYARSEDRLSLAQILEEEMKYLLGQVGKAGAAGDGLKREDAALKLRTDALQKEAIQLRRDLGAAVPDDAPAHFFLGDALRSQGKLDDAIAVYREALRLDPNDAKLHDGQARALAGKGLRREAIAEYREAARLMPEGLPWTRFELVSLLANAPETSLRNPPEALEHARRGVEITGGKSPGLHGALALAEYRSGHWDEALDALQKIETLGGTDYGYQWFLRAVIHAQIGEKEHARSWFERAVNVLVLGSKIPRLQATTSVRSLDGALPTDSAHPVRPEVPLCVDYEVP
jgi:tetratricopeptide (TPR) repeat protein